MFYFFSPLVLLSFHGSSKEHNSAQGAANEKLLAIVTCYLLNVGVVTTVTDNISIFDCVYVYCYCICVLAIFFYHNVQSCLARCGIVAQIHLKIWFSRTRRVLSSLFSSC